MKAPMDARGLTFSAAQPDSIGALASWALSEEADLFPKPGLVDPAHRGAHTDMDHALLRASASSLRTCFTECAEAGRKSAGRDPRSLFEELRAIGRRGETAMYGATHGINTHKGAIFSLGILAASAARVAAGAGGGGRDFSAEAALDCAAAMCSGLVRAELEPAAHFPGPSPTAGERQFREHGCRGARGQAEDGFPTIRLCVLPVLRSARGRAPRVERAARLDALLSVIAVLEDSCILKRGGLDALAFARREAGSVLAAGGASAIGGMAALRRLDRTFCERGLSPGGAADMLAGGIFLDRLEAELHAEGALCEVR